AGMQLEASEWEVVLPGVPADAAACAVRALLAAPSVRVERLTSKGTRTLDARAAVISLTVQPGQPGQPGLSGQASQARFTSAQKRGTAPIAEYVILRMTVRQMTPAVRPDDILAALRQLSAPAPTSPPLVTRMWQGPISTLTAGLTDAQTGTTEASATARP